MADENDMIALEKGDIDMVKRDFRSANLSGRDMTGRDFTYAHFERADISRANLTGSTLSQYSCMQMNAQGAILRNVSCESTAHFGVNFRDADLRMSRFTHSHFGQCDFSSADLRGANFSKCHINEGSTFTGAISDGETLFDGATIFRPLATDPVFRFYKVERGVLLRRSPEETTISDVDLRRQIDAKIDVIERELTKIDFSSDRVKEPGLGHNNPPDEIPSDVVNPDQLKENLREIRLEVSKEEPERERLDKATNTFSSIGAKFLTWLSKKLDIAAESFAKKAGESLASKPVWISMLVIFGGHLDDLQQMLLALLNTLK